MKIVIRKMGLNALRERFKNEIILAALILCIFTFLASGFVLFMDTYDTHCNSEVQQCYEIYQGSSAQGEWDWWKNKTIRIQTGRYEYHVDYLPYWGHTSDIVDEMNAELRGKQISVQYRKSLWTNRSAVGIEHNGKVYIDPEDTLALRERRVGTRDSLLALYVLLDLLVLVPMSLGIIRIERKTKHPV